MLVVIVVLFALVLYRLTILYWYLESTKIGEYSSSYAELIGSISASILTVIFIIIFSHVKTDNSNELYK